MVFWHELNINKVNIKPGIPANINVRDIIKQVIPKQENNLPNEIFFVVNERVKT